MRGCVKTGGMNMRLWERDLRWIGRRSAVDKDKYIHRCFGFLQTFDFRMKP